MKTKLLKKTDQIQIIGRRWFDKVNGNTYCSSQILINGDTVKTLGMTYGYGNYYEQMSLEWLVKNGYIKDSNYETRNKHKLVSTYSDGLKRELFKGGYSHDIG